MLSLLVCDAMIPLRDATARAAVVGPDRLESPWLAEAQRVVLQGRRVGVEQASVTWPAGLTPLAAGEGPSARGRPRSAPDRRGGASRPRGNPGDDGRGV